MSILDGNGNLLTSAVTEAAEALEGPDFGTTSTQQEPEGVVEVAPEGAELPAYDFGEGELGQKVSKLKNTLAEKGLLPNAPAVEGEETPKDAEGPTTDGPLKGSEIDWSEFDLDPNYAHFYPLSEFTVTGQGPKWVVVISEYETFEKPLNMKIDPTTNRPEVDKKGQPRSLGAYITSRLNSPPDMGTGPWGLIAIFPGTMGNAGAAIVRKVPIVLPDPKRLEKETKVEAATDEELSNVDDAAAKWAGVEAAPVTEPVAPSLAQQIADEVFSGPEV